MSWTINLSQTAQKQLKKLDHTTRERIISYMEEVATLDNPRARGKALTGPYGGLWRYRVEDHRVVCSIHNEVCLILVVRIGHRRDIYA